MKHILSTLAFYAKYQGIQSFSKTDKRTKNAIKSLENKGYLRVNWQTSQASHTGKTFV